jgi:hypothetical protein
LGFVLWRVDAPNEKDFHFSPLVIPVWVFSALLIARRGFARARILCSPIGALCISAVSTLAHILVLFVFSTALGAQLHLLAGGWY